MIEEQVMKLAPEVIKQYSQVNIMGDMFGLVTALIFIILGIVGLKKSDEEAINVIGLIGLAVGGLILVACIWDLVGWFYFPAGKVLESITNK